ncbi:MAG: DUF2269 domain-containing protein [Alphaproteobacteria bacterium]|nr:DUF2269 domain-containing protein [Alphaproteobacteria bacterium]
MLYEAIKTLHILSATILFGTGIGIAFFMFRSHATTDLQGKLYAARNTVLADMIFTLPAVIIQPLSGIWLVMEGGYGWNEAWLLATYALYALAGVCWLPVVWIQIDLKRMLQIAADTGAPLPQHYHGRFRLWFILGWPAFLGLVAIFFLMVAKPT